MLMSGKSTMKIAKKQSKFPKKIIIIAIGLLIIGGAGAFGLYQSQRANNIAKSNQEAVRPVNDVDYSPPTADEQQQQEDTKTDVIKQNEGLEEKPPTQAATISVTVSRVNQDAGKGASVNVRTIISGTTRGTCTVEFKKSGQTTVTKTFPIIVQATYSTCQTADVPAADFSADGEWTYSISARNDTSTSNTATGTVTITK
jgi:hypothetical protein